jgi:hypothetical protein
MVSTLVHPNDEDLSLGTPKPQKQKRGEGGAPDCLPHFGESRNRMLYSFVKALPPIDPTKIGSRSPDADPGPPPSIL